MSSLMLRSHFYQDPVRWVEETGYIEAKILIFSDRSSLHHVILNFNYHLPPTCCTYSRNGSGLPPYHGRAVLFEKYGSVNLHNFIAKM